MFIKYSDRFVYAYERYWRFRIVGRYLIGGELYLCGLFIEESTGVIVWKSVLDGLRNLVNRELFGSGKNWNLCFSYEDSEKVGELIQSIWLRVCYLCSIVFMTLIYGIYLSF